MGHPWSGVAFWMVRCPPEQGGTQRFHLEVADSAIVWQREARTVAVGSDSGPLLLVLRCGDPPVEDNSREASAFLLV